MKKFKAAFFLVIALTIFLFTFDSPRAQDRPEENIKGTQKTSGSKRHETFKRETLPSEAEISLVIGQLESMFEKLEEAEDELNRNTFDSQAVLDEMGSDPKAPFQWVREQTVLVPYKGSLRGPQGVLMDGLGNSLDRALLLHELMDRAGHEVRLARASLSEEKAKELLHKMRKILSSTPRPPEKQWSQSVEDIAEGFAAKYQLNSTEIKNVIKRRSKEQERNAREISDQASEQASAIIAAIGRPKTRGSSLDESLEIEALQDHWWVQWLNKETWVDMDPTLPDSQLGQVLAEAEDWCDSDDLDEGLLHLVQIRLVIEQWKDGQLDEKIVLEHTLRPSELLDKRIVLRHYPLDWPLEKDPFEEKDLLQGLKAVILDQRAWVPTLHVGSEEIVGTMFKDTGEFIEKKKKAGGITGFRRSLLEAFQDKNKEEKPKKDAFLTAEWIEYQICSPGQPSRTTRRQVFDLLGPAQRVKESIPTPVIEDAHRMNRSLSILGQTDILILTNHLPTEFIEFLSIKNLLANREILLDLLPLLNEAKPQEVLTRMGELTPQPGRLYDLALARSKIGWPGRTAYIDHPNVISLHSQLKQNPQGELLKYMRLDIVENDIAVFDEDPFLARLKQGVLDTNIEAFLMGPKEKVENTSVLFAEDSDWLTLSDTEEEVFKGLELNPDAYERIKRDLEDGYIVLAPKKAVKMDGRECIAWWRVNRRTGHTIGVGEHGWGQALVEYVEVAQTMIQLKLQIESYMDIMKCIMSTAALAVAGADMKTVVTYAIRECIWDTICNYIMGKLTGHFLADTIWSNFIVEKTADWITENLCASALD